jgi:predicted phage terminase large subunit-like protein
LNIKNKRPTKVILDDIEDDEQVKSAERRAKLQHWIFSVIMPTLHRKQGRMKWVGTILSPECELLKFYKKFGGVFRKAIENGKALWPQVWDLEALENKKEEIGTRAFSQEYLNTPINDELSIIKKTWLEKSVFSVIDKKGLKLIITVDPQSGQSAEADYCGISLVGFYPKDKHRYIMEVKLIKGEQTDQAREIIKLWHENKDQVLIVGAEVVLTQVAVFQLIVNWKNRKIEIAGLEHITDRNIPVRSVSPGGKNKIDRLKIHEPAFERGEIHIHQGLESFMTNLTAFPDVAHDDDVDAMIYALDLSYKINPLQSPSDKDYNKNKSDAKTVVGNLKKKTF